MDVRLAATDEGYVAGKKAVLERAGLKAWAIAAHLIGQCVGVPWDPRLDGFAPSIFKGKSEAIVRELNSAGHEGPLSVEWEDSGMDRERGAAEALEYARRIDFASAGMAFDGAMKR